MFLIQLLLVISILGVIFAALYVVKNNAVQENRNLTELMGSERSAKATGGKKFDVEQIKKITGVSRQGKADVEDLDLKLFRAGIFTDEDKQKFFNFRKFSMPVGAVVFPIAIYSATGEMTLTLVSTILGAFVGYALPISGLERAIRARQEGTLYYLPLVIEQVSIGVSSSLDLGPCLANIVKMADERNSHNPVTEMLIHVEKLIKSGLNLEDSLREVSEANGMPEIKHAFMFLAQCAKHGGEVSKQLQELADTLQVQRQIQIEGKITALPVKATFPLLFVFGGFFLILMAGLAVKLVDAFPKG